MHLVLEQRSSVIKGAVLLMALGACSAMAAGEGAIRDIRVDGNVIWAAGDGGLVLKSDDGGRTFRSLKTGTTANFQSISMEGPSAAFIGGTSVVGGIDGMGQGVVVRTDDGGETFYRLGSAAMGWLYTGKVSGNKVLAAGQSSGYCPGGIWLTNDGGKKWKPAGNDSGRGFMTASCIHDFQVGCFFGTSGRMVGLNSNRWMNISLESGRADVVINDGTITDDNMWWAVGRFGLVVTGHPPATPWKVVNLPFPPGARRVSMLKSVDFRGKNGTIAGGLSGIMFHTSDGGKNFKPLPAPGPGQVNVVRNLGKGFLLAGGDAGRIWRSEDGGRTWKLLRGNRRTDILFVVAAGDISIYPAIVYHALCGSSVAVLYVTIPRSDLTIPSGQKLHSAAVAAGASSVAMLHDFPSIAELPSAVMAKDTRILDSWRQLIDMDPEAEMARQISIAIRLFRPAVVVTGPDERGPRGVLAENRIAARAARAAVELAGRPLKKGGTTASLFLDSHKVARIFTGQEVNEKWTPPWEKPPIHAGGEPSLQIDGRKFAKGEESSVEMLAARAVWHTGGTGVLTRPPMITMYTCSPDPGIVSTMTKGLDGCSSQIFPRLAVSDSQSALADLSSFRLADSTNDLPSYLKQLIVLSEKQRDESGIDPSILVADRLLLLWRRCLEKSMGPESEAALQFFLKSGHNHPLFGRMNVIKLAQLSSAEYRSETRRIYTELRRPVPDYTGALKKFSTWTGWATTAAGCMLQGRALAVTGDSEGASSIFSRIIKGGYSDEWRRCASLELGRGDETANRVVVKIPYIDKPGRVDGRLNEPFWEEIEEMPLSAAAPGKTQGQVAGTAKIFRSLGSVAIGLRLRQSGPRRWKVSVAIDSDRDTWTQMICSFDSLGGKSAELSSRLGPPMRLSSKTFLVSGPVKEGGYETFEIAVPLDRFGNPLAGYKMNFQILAESTGPKGVGLYGLQPQRDSLLKPERYGLLHVPEIRRKKTSP